MSACPCKKAPVPWRQKRTAPALSPFFSCLHSIADHLVNLDNLLFFQNIGTNASLHTNSLYTRIP